MTTDIDRTMHYEGFVDACARHGIEKSAAAALYKAAAGTADMAKTLELLRRAALVAGSGSRRLFAPGWLRESLGAVRGGLRGMFSGVREDGLRGMRAGMRRGALSGRIGARLATAGKNRRLLQAAVRALGDNEAALKELYGPERFGELSDLLAAASRSAETAHTSLGRIQAQAIMGNMSGLPPRGPSVPRTTATPSAPRAPGAVPTTAAESAADAARRPVTFRDVLSYARAHPYITASMLTPVAGGGGWLATHLMSNPDTDTTIPTLTPSQQATVDRVYNGMNYEGLGHYQGARSIYGNLQ